ncbi:MAG: glutamine amidotransferase [bacterium]|nr:glutamine amidotransferase [bacterium]
MKIRIVHLYPDLMNIYGDIGNIIALKKRSEWRSIEVEIKNISTNDKLEFKKGDILFMGGGQDRGQLLVASDLNKKSQIIKKAIISGLPALVICGAYQLFGKYFLTDKKVKIPGINIFDFTTVASNQRMIGNIVVDSQKFGRLIGFENHSGQTVLANNSQALGKVIKGFGNNNKDKFEGMILNNVIGTYMHGSFLPKNPKVTDFLIAKAAKKIDPNFKLKKLDDSLENQANQFAASRP